MCPVLCSGQGDYSGGECVCRPGWKGKECNVRWVSRGHAVSRVTRSRVTCHVSRVTCRYEECEVPDCSGHGHCEDGKCVCMKVSI